MLSYIADKSMKFTLPWQVDMYHGRILIYNFYVTFKLAILILPRFKLVVSTL
jgi:hypothetical protein